MMETVSNLANTYAARADVVTCDLDGGRALLDLKTSEYYTLNETGAFIWSCLSEGQSLAECLSSMLAQFEVSREDAANDLSSLVESLEKEGLIERNA